MFGRLQVWRCIATHDHRCPQVFLSIIACASADVFCLEINDVEAEMMAPNGGFFP